MEHTLQKINAEFVSLNDSEVKNNNDVLEQILGKIVTAMKEINPLFKSLYQRTFYGGSFYDDLKVGKPEEYDIDLLLKFPVIAAPKVKVSNNPGYVHVLVEDLTKFKKQPESAKYKGIDDLLEDNYLSTTKVMKWFQSSITKTLDTIFQKRGKFYIITHGHRTYTGILSSSVDTGPAFTLKLSSPQSKIDIDLVPCFVFGANQWPTVAYKTNPTPYKPEFFVVPKHSADGAHIKDRYWRLSFQEQERELMKDKRNFKPILRLLKSLRDNQNQAVIKSYYLKTIFLWEQESKNIDFKNNSLSYNFMFMLKKYYEYVQKHSIHYFWYKKFNLVEKVSGITLTNIANQIKNIIDKIDRNPNGNIIENYLVPNNITTDCVSTHSEDSNSNGNDESSCTIL